MPRIKISSNEWTPLKPGRENYSCGSDLAFTVLLDRGNALDANVEAKFSEEENMLHLRSTKIKPHTVASVAAWMGLTLNNDYTAAQSAAISLLSPPSGLEDWKPEYLHSSRIVSVEISNTNLSNFLFEGISATINSTSEAAKRINLFLKNAVYKNSNKNLIFDTKMSGVVYINMSDIDSIGKLDDQPIALFFDKKLECKRVEANVQSIEFSPSLASMISGYGEAIKYTGMFSVRNGNTLEVAPLCKNLNFHLAENVQSLTFKGPSSLSTGNKSHIGSLEITDGHQLSLTSGPYSRISKIKGRLELKSVRFSKLGASPKSNWSVVVKEDSKLEGAEILNFKILKSPLAFETIRALNGALHLSPSSKWRDLIVANDLRFFRQLTACPESPCPDSKKAPSYSEDTEALEYSLALAALYDQKSSGLGPARLRWATYRLRSLTSKSKFEKFGLFLYRIIGFGCLPGPAFVAWLFLGIMTAFVWMSAMGFPWALDAYLYSLVRSLFWPINLGDLGIPNEIGSDSPDGKDAWLALAPALHALLFGSLTTALLSFRKMLKIQ